MISPRISLLLVSAALVVALAIGVDWLVAEWLAIGSSQARWWLLTITLALVTAALALLAHRERTIRRAVVERLDTLAHQDLHRLAANLPLADATHDAAWSRTTARLHGRLVGLARQVNELERERADLAKQSARFEAQSRRVRSVLSALGEPVLVVDKRDDVILTNSSADRLLALDRHNTEERALATLVQCQELIDLLTETRKNSTLTQQSRELELAAPDGTKRWFRVTARNMPTRPGDSDPDGTSQGAVALLQDISSQRQLQKRNAEFVSAVSHEMKTPLAGVRAYVELLTDGDAEDEPARQKFLGVIAAETARLECLVDDLVELARIEADPATTRRHVCDLDAVLAEATTALRAAAAEKRIEVVASGPTGIRVEGDPLLLVHAFEHLLSNAVKYTQPGGRVLVRASSGRAEVCVELEDTGVGLSDEDCRRVFEKFYRVPGHRGLAGGAGLGLPLVKHIVEDVHGGRIEVESQVGRGSTFRVWLPRVRSGQGTDAAGDTL